MNVPSVCVEVTRGPLVESEHRVDVAVVDASGRWIAAAGDPERVTYWRSAAKPVQAIAALVAGAEARFGLTDADIALIASSHNGEEVHVAGVRALLEKIGAGEAELACGIHPPWDKLSAERLLAEGRAPSALHNNCSGKHAGMLALARLLGVDARGYLDPRHPVQERIFAQVVEITGTAEIPIGIDGCGVPVYGLPLWRMAYAYARLVSAGDAGAPWASAARRVVRAMLRHPHLVAGTGRTDTLVMRSFAGAVVCKEGAEGVWCIGLPERGWGIALKVLDGERRAAAPAGLAVLRALGVWPAEEGELTEIVRPVLRNHAGTVVGEIRARLPEQFGISGGRA